MATESLSPGKLAAAKRWAASDCDEGYETRITDAGVVLVTIADLARVFGEPK